MGGRPVRLVDTAILVDDESVKRGHALGGRPEVENWRGRLKS
jgi:hypothetical protein